VAPAQPMIGQTRAVLDAYAADGGSYREVALENCSHSPHLEHPDVVRTAILEHLSR
jgi:pimeloyl-ACP methyl ester carboxylesterase